MQAAEQIIDRGEALRLAERLLDSLSPKYIEVDSSKVVAVEARVVGRRYGDVAAVRKWYLEGGWVVVVREIIAVQRDGRLVTFSEREEYVEPASVCECSCDCHG